MRHLVLLVILVGAALTSDREAYSQTALSAEREVFTRQQLQAAGMQRLSELIPWLGTSAGTIESLAWIMSVDELPPSRLFAGGMAGPAIFVDGQPVSISAHEEIFPELLPVSLPQIDSIVVTRAPALTGGTFSERGSIHFHTSPVVPGFSARAWGRHGAETGDPGPYRYTPKATPNIDRSGPDRVGVAGYGGERWDVEVTARAMKTGVSDSLITAYFGELPHVFGYPRSMAIKLGGEAAGGRHQLLLARSWHLSNVHLPTIGVGHTTISQRYGGVAGSMAVRAVGIGYRVTHSAMSSELSSPSATFDRSRTHASAEARLPRGHWAFTGGASVDRVTMEPETQAVPVVEVERLYPALLASVERASTRSAGELSTSLKLVEGKVAERLAGSARWEISPGRLLIASGSYAAPEAEEEEGLAYTLSHPGVEASRYRIYRASLGLSQRVLGLAASAAAALGGSSSVDGEAAAPERDRRGRSFVGLTANLETPAASRVQTRLVYRMTHPLDDGESLPTLSRHHFRGFLSYDAHPSLRFGAATLWKSAAVWPEEEYAAGGGSTLEPINRVDLSIEKWFWKKRLRTQLMIGNVLMRPERYHPSGANFSFRYFVGAGLDLPVR